MNALHSRTKKNEQRTVAAGSTKRPSHVNTAELIKDNRPNFITQRKLKNGILTSETGAKAIKPNQKLPATFQSHTAQLAVWKNPRRTKKDRKTYKPPYINPYDRGPIFDTIYIHPSRSNWPITSTLRTAQDFINHFQKPKSRDKFTTSELVSIDGLLHDANNYRIRKINLLHDLSDCRRSMRPEDIPTNITKVTGVPKRTAYHKDLKPRIKEHYKTRLEYLLTNFFDSYPDIQAKVSWRLPRLANPFTNIPGLSNLQLANNWDSSPIAYTPSNIKGLTGAAGTSVIRFKKLTPTSKPADLKNQSTWFLKGILGDKNIRNQQLTKMHQIRGRFGGPSDQNNMFLGTAASNLTHINSHVNEVEDRIAWAITSAPKWGITDFYVDYAVSPAFGTIAPDVQTQINAKLTGQDKKDAEAWCKEATPQQYHTDWTIHVLLNSGQTGTYHEQRTLNADE